MCHASNVATKTASLLSFLRHHSNQVWGKVLGTVLLRCHVAGDPCMMPGATLSLCVLSAHCQVFLLRLRRRLFFSVYRIWHTLYTK